MKKLLLFFMAFFLAIAGFAQVPIYTEDMGTTGTNGEAISAHTFSNTAVSYSGTADLRTTNASSSYTTASGSFNMMFNAVTDSCIIETINTTGYTNLSLSFGIRKGAAGADGSTFLVLVSTDGVIYTNLSFTLLPTGTGTTGWYYRTIMAGIPTTQTLYIKFKTTSGDEFRLDDILLTGETLTTTPQNCPTVPLNESFENTYPPTGWATINTAFTQYTNIASDGTKSIGYGGGSSSYPTYGIAMPQITVQQGTALSFKKTVGMAYDPSNTWYTSFRVMVSTTNQTPASSYTIIKEFSNFLYTGINSNNVIQTNIAGVWQECVTDLSAYAGQNVYIAIQVYDHYGDDQIRIDEIKINTPVTDDLTATTLTPSNAIINMPFAPKVVVTNSGTNAVTAGSYTVVVTDGASYTETLSGTALAFGASTTFTFPSYTATTTTSVTLTATVNYSGDECNTDNTINNNITVHAMPTYTHNAYVAYPSTSTYYSFDIFTGALTQVATGLTGMAYSATETWVGDNSGNGIIVRVTQTGEIGVVMDDASFIILGMLNSPVVAQPMSLAYDRTNSILYVIAYDASGNNILGTINLQTYDVTTIGTVNITNGLIIGMDIANDGYIYALDIVNNNIQKINTTDATATLIGTTGLTFADYYYQDLAFDYVTNKMYSFARESTTSVKYGYYNLTTGAFTEIAPITQTGQYSAITIITNTLPTCEQVTNLQNSQVSTTTATVTFDAPTTGTPTGGYQYYMSTTNTAPDAAYPVVTSDIVMAETINITNLTPQSHYYVWVRSVCDDTPGSEVTSSWSNFNTNFITPCNAIQITEATPFTENFDSYTGTTWNTAGPIPSCWYTFAQSGSAAFTPHITGSGSYFYPILQNALTFTAGSDNYGGANTYAVLPPFDLPINQLALSFYRQMESSVSGTLTVGYITGAQNDLSTYTVIQTITNITGTSTLATVSLSSVPANATYLAFRWSYNTSYYTCGIDNVVVRALSSENDILTFTLPTQTTTATIDDINHTVNIEVSSSTIDLTALIPTITVSPLANISPASGIANDFSTPAVYTVTAENGTQQQWTVTVTQAATASSEKDILTFNIPNQISSTITDVDATNGTITVTIPWNATIGTHTPAITVSPNATIAPLSGVAQNFTAPVNYVVTAEDASTKTYAVTVVNATMPTVTVPWSQNFDNIQNASAEILNLGGNTTDKFAIGSATGNNAPALYVSANGGTSNNYTQNSAYATAEYIVDFGNFAEYILSFDWKCYGEGGADYGRVYIMNTTENITSNTFPAGALNTSNFQSNGTSWTHVEYTLSGTAYAGTTKKLVFAWRTDGSVINNNPLAIDNISIQGFVCGSPMAITAVPTNNSATISWTAPVIAPADGYQVYYSTTNIAPTGTETFIDVAAGNTSTTISPLTAGTIYYVWIRSNCGSSDYSNWTNSYSFNTLCDPITTMPFIETFETTSTTRICWTMIDANADGDVWILNNDTYYAHAGSYSAQMHTDLNYGNNDDWLISPPITLTNNSLLKYWYRARSSYEPDAFEVLLSTTGIQPSDFTNVLLPTTEFNNTTYMQQPGIDLSAFTGQTVFIAWHVPQGGPDGYYINIDDIEIIDCSNVSNITTANLTQTSTDLTWTGLSSTGYNIEIYSASATPAAGSGDVFTATSIANNINVTATLTAETTYYVYIQSVCNGNWTSYSFTTPSACAIPTGLIANPTAINTTVTWNALGMTDWNYYVSETQLSNPTSDITSSTPVASATATFATTAGTTYYFYVQSDCGSAWSETIFTPNYCTPAPTSVDGGATGGITLVTFGQSTNIVNNSTNHAVNAPMYTNNTAMVGDAYQGSTLNVNITINTGYGYTYNTVIWVDWNNNLQFEASEVVFVGETSNSSPTTIYTNFTIPSNTPTGNYRMRIGMADSGLDSPPYNPCYNGSYADFEDYTLQVLLSHEIASITPVSANYEVCEGTTETAAIASLPTTTTITDANAADHTVNLTWAIASYDSNTASVYNATAAFALPTGVIQTNPATTLEVTTTVTVNANPTVTTYSPVTECDTYILPIVTDGVWTNGNGAVVTATDTTGIFTLTVTNAANCTAITTLDVTINTTPATPTVTNVTNCGTYTLPTSTGTDTWTWTDATTAIVTTATATGTYTVTTSENGCTSAPASIDVTINTIPAAPTLSSTATTICEGTNVTLETITNVTWYEGTTEITNLTVTPATTTTYTAFATENGCTSTGTDFVVTVNPLPVIPATIGDLAYCAGSSATLETVTDGVWKNPANQVVTVATAEGLYTLTITDATTGCVNTTTITVTENALPTVETYDPVEHQGTYTLPVVEGGVWTNEANEVVTAAAEDGTYTLTVTNANGCSATTTLLVDILTKINEVSTSSISVYPNPSNGEFTINLGNTKNAKKYQIIDMKGAIVTEANVTDQLQQVNVNVLPGNYTVKVITESSVYIENVVIR